MKDQKIRAPHGNAAGRDVIAPVVHIQSVSETNIIGNQGNVHVRVSSPRRMHVMTGLDLSLEELALVRAWREGDDTRRRELASILFGD